MVLYGEKLALGVNIEIEFNYVCALGDNDALEVFFRYAGKTSPTTQLEDYLTISSGSLKIRPTEQVYLHNDYSPALPAISREDFLKRTIALFDLYYDINEIDKKVIVCLRNDYYKLGTVREWKSSTKKYEFKAVSSKIGTIVKYEYLEDNNDLTMAKVKSAEKWDFANKSIDLGQTNNLETKVETDGIGYAATCMQKILSNCWMPRIEQANPLEDSFVDRILIHNGLQYKAEGHYFRVSDTESITEINYCSNLYFYLENSGPNDFHLGFENFCDKKSQLQKNDIGMCDRLHFQKINQMKTGKIVVMKFQLSEKDIFDFSFSDLLLWNDQLFIVNRINNYSLTKDTDCDVELITQ